MLSVLLSTTLRVITVVKMFLRDEKGNQIAELVAIVVKISFDS